MRMGYIYSEFDLQNKILLEYNKQRTLDCGFQGRFKKEIGLYKPKAIHRSV